MVFLTGPRQVGKTWLAKALTEVYQRPQYLNYDSISDAAIIRSGGWALNTDCLVLDELHKMKAWKGFIKGVFDTRPAGQAIMITGSSRLDTFRQTGESLAGRYFHYHLHPLSVRELSGEMSAAEALAQLNRFGGFPEPFLSQSETEATRWRNQYYTDLVREDILEFSRLQEIRGIRLLVEMLRERVGAPVSYTSLAGDLQLAPNTVRRYVDILAALYIIFLIRPYHHNIARAILKEPKIYFYDSGYVKGDEGRRLENTCAVCLLKHVDYLRDTQGENVSLNYVKTKEGKEVDFSLTGEDGIISLIEVKLSEDQPSPALRYYRKKMPAVPACQLVQHLRQEQHWNGIDVVNAGRWLAELAA